MKERRSRTLQLLFFVVAAYGVLYHVHPSFQKMYEETGTMIGDFWAYRWSHNLATRPVAFSLVLLTQSLLFMTLGKKVSNELHNGVCFLYAGATMGMGAICIWGHFAPLITLVNKID